MSGFIPFEFSMQRVSTKTHNIISTMALHNMYDVHTNISTLVLEWTDVMWI